MPRMTRAIDTATGSPVAEEQAYQQIKRMILRAELAPGARLVHRDLAEMLGMSRNPIVPALRLLEQDGLVVNMPGIGAYVRTWDRDDLADLFETRALLEGLSARLCAKRATRVDMVTIEAANEVFIEANKSRDLEAAVEADIAFHESVVRGAHSAYLETLVCNLSIVSLSINMMNLTSRETCFADDDEQVALHRPIVDALRERDGEAAADAAENHALERLEANLKWFDENMQFKTQ